MPDIAKRLSERFRNCENVQVFDFGLSFESREIDVFWNKSSDDTSSISPRHHDPLSTSADVAKIRCKVELGDAVVDRLGVRKIDLLKIDVEGHEVDGLEQVSENSLIFQTCAESDPV